MLTLMVVDPKISKTFILDNLSHKSWKYAGNIYKINNCTTVHIRLSVPEDNGRFSKGNNIEPLHKSSAEQTVGASDLFAGEVPKEHDLFSCTQHLETMSPLPKENAADGQRTSEVVISYPVFSNSTFCLPLSNEIIGKLFNGMRGKYFHEKTSLELLTYVLTGRGEKSEGTISIEWIASPRSFSLFIGIVCAPYHNKWKMGKSLFTGRINKNPSCDFSRMTELGLVAQALVVKRGAREAIGDIEDRENSPTYDSSAHVEYRKKLINHLEPLALPRYWRSVEKMPHNAQGKLEISVLEKLFYA